MSEIFSNILGISITAGFVSAVIFIIRIILKGAPRWITCLLWGFVALRLLCPVLPESTVSFIPDIESSHNTQQVISEAPAVIPEAVHTHAPEDNENKTLQVLSVIWAAGAGIMLMYGAVSYIVTRLRVRDAVKYKDNIRQSEKVASPFVMGVLRPMIYIPYSLKKKTRKQVLCHEQAHISRLDHIWKLSGFVLLCFHWFNPLMWVAYILLCRDIEVACDEKVIKNYNLKARKAYATALLECKMPKSLSPACPLAFGEVGVGVRIKKTLRYKKPAIALAVTGVVLALTLSPCLLTNPVTAAKDEEAPRLYGDNRVTVDYINALEAQTEPVTEEVAQPATEPATDPYEEVYYEDDYYEEDYYDNIECIEVPKPTYEVTMPPVKKRRVVPANPTSYPVIPIYNDNSYYNNYNYNSSSAGWKVADINNRERIGPQYAWEQPYAYNPYTGRVNGIPY